jgi:hypothetical protein
MTTAVLVASANIVAGMSSILVFMFVVALILGIVWLDRSLIGVLTKPIFAESMKLSIDPCQLFSFKTNRRRSPASPCNILLNERSTDAIMSAFGRSCEIVIRNLGLVVQRQVFSERCTTKIQVDRDWEV